MITIEDVSFRYNEEKQMAVQNVTMHIKQGDFVVLFGASGSGKTTLLRLLKRELWPKGEIYGSILINGRRLEELSAADSAKMTGYVFQNPDNQIVTDKVWHEMAFGMENLNWPQDKMKKSMAETAVFFNIEDILERHTWKLSGGEKQKLNLASIMAMKPELLILDEPFGQLSPISAEDFANMLRKIHRELGTTILLAEHNLGYVLEFADMVGIMENGKLLAYEQRNRLFENAKYRKILETKMETLPVPVRFYYDFGQEGKCAYSIRDAKRILKERPLTRYHRDSVPAKEKKVPKEEPVLELEHIYFRYQREQKDILKDVKLKLYRGEICGMIGGNGCGKTTLLKVAAGLLNPYRGKRKVNRRVGYLPQNPQSVFVKDSVLEEFREVCKEEKQIQRLVNNAGLGHLLERHPYDLSGGEQQKAAIVKVLLTNPEILLIDEPTKGLDAYGKQQIGELFCGLQREGGCIFLVTHDIEFAAEYTSRLALLFWNEIAMIGETRDVLCGNDFYTTASHRIIKDECEHIFRYEELKHYVERGWRK